VSGRVEDPALLTGQGRFIEDLDGPAGTMQAAIVRSTLPHARITRFDASAAERAPGVRAVIGPEQISELAPFPLSAPAPMPYRPGAVERVR
jgi:2-furoyl-CoA dehydrogenase large subunit